MKYSGSFNEKFRLYTAVICLAGFLFNFIAVFPGLMSEDSFRMYNMGVKWAFGDGHHPFIGFLMGLGRSIRNDPSPYLFFQLALFWSGLYLLSLAFFTRIRWWALLVPCIAIMPFNFSLSGYLHKTPLLSACFLFSFSWLYYSSVMKKKIGLTQIMILIPILFLGSVVRGYSYLAALPLLFLLIWLYTDKGPNQYRNTIKAAIVSFLLVFLFIVVNNFLVYKVLEAKKFHKYQILYTIDMASIYALTGNVYAGEFLKKPYKNRKKASQFYRKMMKRDIWRVHRMYKWAYTDEEINRLKAEWLRAVSENFPVYLKHRQKVILRTFGVTGKVVYYKGFIANDKSNIHQLVKYDSTLWRHFKKYIQSTGKMFFMKPWFWAISNVFFSCIGFILILIPRYRQLVLPHCLLIWSGFLLLAPYVLLCLSADNRFTYWVTVATSFGGFGIVSTLLPHILPMDTESVSYLETG